MFIIKTALKNIREKWLIYSVLGLLFIMLSAFICSTFNAYIYSTENFDKTRKEIGTYVYLKNIGEAYPELVDENFNTIGYSTEKYYRILDDMKWYNSFGKDAGFSGYEARSALSFFNPDKYYVDEPRIHGFTDDFEMSIGEKTLEYSVFWQRYLDIITQYTAASIGGGLHIGIYEFDPDYENALDSEVNEFAVKNNVRGKMPENDSEILINDELLQMFNGAKVGDTLCFKYTTADNKAFEKEYLITGIISNDFFYTNAMRYYTTLHSNLKYKVDDLIAFATVFKEKSAFEEVVAAHTKATIMYERAYMLDDIDNFDKSADYVALIREENKSIGKDGNISISWCDFELVYTVANAKEQLKTLDDVENRLIISFIIAVVLDIVTMAIITIAVINECRYSVGVYMSIGMPKRKIAAIYVCQLLLSTLLTAAIGTLCGLLLFDRILPLIIGATDIVFTVNPQYMLAMFAAETVITVIAAFAAVLPILSFRPMQILRSRV